MNRNGGGTRRVVFFAATAGVVLLGRWATKKTKTGRWTSKCIASLQAFVLRAHGMDRKNMVLLPPALEEHNQEAELVDEKNIVLFVFFPGANLYPHDYVQLIRVLQKNAVERYQLQVVAGVVFSAFHPAGWILWALQLFSRTHEDYPQGVANYLTEQAHAKVEQALEERQNNNPQRQEKQFINSDSKKPFRFAAKFVGGHSLGGISAFQAAYPSGTNATILLGCTTDVVANLRMATGHNDNTLYNHYTAHDILASYPRPLLTIMGELDGMIRYYHMATGSQRLQEDVKSMAANSSFTNATLDAKQKLVGHLEHQLLLEKPMIVMDAVNHMQVAMDVTAPVTLATGRKDFVSPLSLEEAHDRVASAVVDFLHIHSPSTRTLPSSDAQHRMFALGRSTQERHLGPYAKLVDRGAVRQFVCDLQKEHILYAKSKHHQGVIPDHDISISCHWHVTFDDFLYSKPKFTTTEGHIWVEIFPQEPLNFSPLPPLAQLSPTMAIKGKLRASVLNLADFNDYPSLQERNRQTFHHVLHHVVTSEQRKWYEDHGRPVEFGPDVAIEDAPDWGRTPMVIEKRYYSQEEISSHDMRQRPKDFCFVLRSPFTTTSPTLPWPWGGAWYIKPLMSAQAYEYIVFDAFK